MLPEVELTDTVVGNAILQGCSAETRAALRDRGTLTTFAGGDWLFSEGQPGGMAFLTFDGKLLLSKTAPGGRRQVLCKMVQNHCSGLCLLTMGDTCLADVRALEAGSLLTIPREELESLAQSDPVLGRAVIAAAVHCMTHFVQSVENLSFHKVAERVRLALLSSTSADGDMVRQTQAELAAEVGTTREVVARCLADLQEHEAIHLGRARITVTNRARLSEMR